MPPAERLHRFTRSGRRFAIDTDTCFCFECDDITADILDYYPREPVNRIYHLLESKHDRNELAEVIGELEWLRATKSILPVRNPAEQEKWLTLERGLEKLAVDLRGADTPVAKHFDACVELLIGRSGKHTNLELELIADRASAPETIAQARAKALRAATFSGKEIIVWLRVDVVQSNPSLAPHRLELRVPLNDAEAEPRLANVLAFSEKPAKLAAIAKQLSISESGQQGSAILHVGNVEFGSAVATLHREGVTSIAIDLDALFLRPFDTFPDPRPSMEATAAFYAERLLNHDYFRLEPLAGLFRQIHQGAPMSRRDPVGTYALGVQSDAAIVPSLDMPHQAGSVVTGELDQHALRAYDDVGSDTTGSCRSCWARNLCGGGIAAVHEALTGSMRTPYEPWCALQRDWLEIAVNAFNTVAGSGVAFDRIYAQLDRKSTPSLFQIARAAFRSDIGLRPLAESDAEMLRDWETWNRAAYFLMNERGVVAGNAYERELDATHPRAGEFEMMIVTKRGEPAGLLKVRRGNGPGVADLFLYLRHEDAYRSSGVARGLRGLIKDAATGQSLITILTPVAPWERELAELLVNCGFTSAGKWRDALFTQSRYHDVEVFAADVTAL